MDDRNAWGWGWGKQETVGALPGPVGKGGSFEAVWSIHRFHGFASETHRQLMGTLNLALTHSDLVSPTWREGSLSLQS